MEEIINYINSTPENSNPNVLRGLLQTMSDRILAVNATSGIMVTVDDQGVFDKTYNEVSGAMVNEKLPVYVLSRTDYDEGVTTHYHLLVKNESYEGTDNVGNWYSFTDSDGHEYQCTSINDYPTL